MLEKIRYMPAVKVVLRFGDRVPEIPDAVIEDLRQGLTELSSQVLTDAPVEGEEVEIATGAFVGTKALIAHVLPGKQRARILLDVMGRSVPAELSLDCVLFNRRNAARIALSRAESAPEDKPVLRYPALPPREQTIAEPERALLEAAGARAIVHASRG